MRATTLTIAGLALGLSGAGSSAKAQEINDYSGFVERQSFHTWSETPQLAGNAKSSTDFTETQTTVVRIERGKVAATYHVDYSYGVNGSNSGSFMDGRCPVKSSSTDEEIQIFPEQAVPAEASIHFNRDSYSLGVEFRDNAVGVRTTKADRILSYNRGAKFCPDNPDKFYSEAKEFIRAVDGIRVDKQPLAANGVITGSIITPASTLNAKPGRIETGWESVRWFLSKVGPTCKPRTGDEQYYQNMAAEYRRLEKARNDASLQAMRAGADGKTSQSDVKALYEKRDALTREMRDFAEKNKGSTLFPIYGGEISAQAFASAACATRG